MAPLIRFSQLGKNKPGVLHDSCSLFPTTKHLNVTSL